MNAPKSMKRLIWLIFLLVCVPMRLVESFLFTPSHHSLSVRDLSPGTKHNAPGLRRSGRRTTKLHVFERMSEECIAALITAQKQTAKLQLPTVGTEAALAGCIDHPESEALRRTLQQYRITLRQAERTLMDMYKESTNATLSQGWLSSFRAAVKDEDLPFGNDLKKTLVKAGKLADQMGSTAIQTHHLFLALLEFSEGGGKPTAAAVDPETDLCHCGAWAALLKMQTFDSDTVSALDICESLVKNLEQSREDARPELVTGVGSGAKTPTLADCGTDLTQLALDGLLDPVYGRDKEIRSCLRILIRRRKNNACLIGEAGVGKVSRL
jgi:ATP-dependent Clp protease ATP-binding subunit ClpC